MISALLFDFGGTLDGDGLHWLDRFYRIYDLIGHPDIPLPAIKEAFYWADAQADVDAGMRTATWRDMMNRHVHWQFEKLGLNNPQKEAEAAALFNRPAERVLHRNRRLLEQLHMNGMRLGVISNFYGNVNVLCQEFGFGGLFDVVLDSAVVGIKKPDPKLFQMALDGFKLNADQVAMVGDSFERDIVPAKALGMKTFWVMGGTLRPCPDASQVDRVVHSLEDLPEILERERTKANPSVGAV